jgi:hypothetical protein
MEGLALLGINTETGALHWDGREISIKKTVSLGVVERIAIVAAAGATVGLFLIELGKALKAVCT